jgi:hypothetical protein
MPDVRNADPVPDVLRGDMTKSEVAEVLMHLRFGRHSGVATIEVDRHVARFLASLIPPRQRPAA